jgi:hypothetical protein
MSARKAPPSVCISVLCVAIADLFQNLEEARFTCSKLLAPAAADATSWREFSDHLRIQLVSISNFEYVT